MLIQNYRLVLASTSPRRQNLFQLLGLNFDCIDPIFEEKLRDDEEAIPYVLRNAKGKAESIVCSCRNSSSSAKQTLIIAADTVLELDGKVLQKPKSELEATMMLQSLAARTHEVHTGYCIIKLNADGESCIIENKVASSQVTLKELTSEDIASYIASGEPMDKAGAYGIQGLGLSFVESLNGSYPNVMGLPISQVYEGLLKSLN